MNKNGCNQVSVCDQIEQIRVIIYVLSAGLVMGAIIVPLLMLLLLLSSSQHNEQKPLLILKLGYIPPCCLVSQSKVSIFRKATA